MIRYKNFICVLFTST